MAYSKGIVTIPNVTGDIEIIVSTAEAEINPIELYTGNASAYQLNKKYSGTAIADGNGYYLTDIMPVDFATRPYLNFKGVGSLDGTGFPYIYKLAFYKGSTISQVKYITDIGATFNASGFSVNMASYAQYDGMQLQIAPVKGSTALTAASVTPASLLSVKASVEALY